MNKLMTVAVTVFLLSFYGCGNSQEEAGKTANNKRVEAVESHTESQSVASDIEKSDTQSLEEKASSKTNENSMIEKNDNASDDTDSEDSRVAISSSDEYDKKLIELGKRVYQEKACASCHTIGKGRLVGPDLLGVTKRRDKQWLRKWLKNPDEMIRTDPIAKEMLKEYMVPMPNQGLTDEEVEGVIVFFKSEDSKNEN